MKRNIETLHNGVERMGLGFRPHVKTLKVRIPRCPPV
jgi:D-serine deaminase-like pyridoxal phosphate-dependent protein